MVEESCWDNHVFNFADIFITTLLNQLDIIYFVVNYA
jgi:hypothetical protein